MKMNRTTSRRCIALERHTAEISSVAHQINELSRERPGTEEGADTMGHPVYKRTDHYVDTLSRGRPLAEFRPEKKRRWVFEYSEHDSEDRLSVAATVLDLLRPRR